MITRWKLQNNVRHTLNSAIGAGDASITIDIAAPPFKSVAVPDSKAENGRGIVTLTDSLTNPTKIEVVTFSALVDNGNGTLTLSGLVRGAESTIASAFSAGAYVLQCLTAESLDSPLIALDHANGWVLMKGSGDPAVPAAVFSSGGIKVQALNDIDQAKVLDVGTGAQGVDEGLFRIMAGGDEVAFLFTPPFNRDMTSGGDIGIMTMNWYSYPPDFTKPLLMLRNVKVDRLEGLRATRYGVNAEDSLASNVTIDWSGHDIRRMPLASNANVTMLDTSQIYPNVGAYRRLTFIIEIPNVANPGFTVTWSANVEWPNGGAPPSFNVGQNQVRVIDFLYDGQTFFADTMRTYQL